MIKLGLDTPTTDSPEAINNYNILLQNASKRDDEIKSLEEANKPIPKTAGEKFEAAWLTNFWGYAPVKETIEATADSRELPVTTGGLAGLITQTILRERAISNPVDESFSLEEKIERLKELKVDPSEWDSLVSSTNRNDFDMRLTRFQNMKEAHKTMAEMPLTEALAYSTIPSLLDPSSGSLFFAGGKALKTLDVASKLTGMGRVIYNGVEGAALVSASVAASEYLIQSQNYVQDQERVDDAAMFGAALGFAVPLLPATFFGVGSVASQAMASKGVQNTLKATGVKDFVQKHLVLNPIDQLLGSPTATQSMKEWAKKADTMLFADRDINGNVIASPSETAMGYRDSQMGGVSDIIMKQIEESKATGKTLSEIDEIQFKDHFDYVNTGRQAANEEIINLTVPERVGLYQQITGTVVKPGKNGKFKYPVDFYNVLENHFLTELKTQGKIVPKAGREHIAAFFKKFSDEGTLLQQPGLAGKEGDVYMPRALNRDMLLSDREGSITKIEEMLLADKLNAHLLQTGELTLKELKAVAPGIYEKALETDMRHRYLGEGAKVGTSPSRMRALRMDTSLYPELFSKSMQLTALEYADNMAGKLAANKFFDMKGGKSGNYGEELREKLTQFAKEGASVQDVKNMEAIIETVLGTRKFQNDPHAIDQMAVRLTKKAAGALYGAGFSIYSLAEVGAIIAKQGLVSTIKNFIPAHQKMLKLIDGTSQNDPILKLFTDMQLAGQYLGMTKHDRFDTLSLQHNVGTVERALDTLNHWGRKVSFFAQLQDILDFMAGGAYFNEVFTLSKNIDKISPAQASRMGRYGLSVDDIVAIGKENIIYHTDGKTVKDYNIQNWNDKDLARKFHYGLQHAVKDTIVRTDGTRISRHLSDNNSRLKQLLFQYMQFPTAAFERLVLNMEEYESRTAVGIITSMVIMYGMNDLADAAMVKLGVKDKRTSTEDLILKSVLSTPFAGLSGTAYDTLAGVAGLTTTGGFTPRPGQMPAGAGLGALAKGAKYTSMSLQDIFKGDLSQAFTDISHVAPILNALPFVNVGFKALAKQESKERPFLGKPYTAGGDTTDPELLKILNNGENK